MPVHPPVHQEITNDPETITTGHEEIGAITNLLRQGQDGEIPWQQIAPLAYEVLRGMARVRMRRERPDHTLQPTALVNEVYLRLQDAHLNWQDRTHFFAVAARLMRRILVDHARASRSDKRGGAWKQITLEGLLVEDTSTQADVLDLDNSLTALSTFDPRKSQILELRFFGGLTNTEIADYLGVSLGTVKRDVLLAQAWIRRELAHIHEHC